MDTDRNLLFGVIALQADLLDATQFAEGCAAWAARKDSALADLLVERGWLTSEDRERVEWLLERKLKRYGGDAGASLAAAVTPEARRVLALWDDPAIQSSLAKLSQEPNSALLSAPTVTPITRDRYTLTTLHAKGGIGQVWRAHDAQLGRDIALKELQPERARDARLRRYFVTEAQVTGQLEHPGIVPVYELTQPAGDGLPFYTMRFVQGRTLTAATHAYHEKRKAGKAGPLDLRELLDAFMKACQTVAYAHARGVIHRDLKGQNIILGDFGEVIVLDWGFAKVLGQPEPDLASPPVVLPEQEAANGTLPGEVIGTPAYMAPEQAEGRLDRLDSRTDVYGLGAILYEILADQPPFTGADQQDVLRRVRADQPTRPRTLHAEVPPALEAVCLKALAKQPSERYPSAADLARDVQQWLADEPVTAYRESLMTRLGRWGRRHRTAVAGGGAGLAAAVVFLAVLAAVIEHGRRQSIAEQHHTEEARQAAVAARRKTRAALDEVGSEAINTLLTKQKELTPAHKKFLRKMLAFYEEFAEEKGVSPETRREVADAHVRMGRIRYKLGEYQEAETAYGRARELYARLAADFPDVPEYRQELANNDNSLGALLQTTSRLKEAEAAYQNALALQTKLAADFPDVPQYQLDLARSHNNLGVLREATDRPKEAAAAYQNALAIKKHLADTFPHEPQYRWDLARGYNSLANLLVNTGRFKEAETAYRNALAIQEQLTDKFPTESLYRKNLAQSQNSLGTLLQGTDRPKEAEKLYREARASFRRLADDFRAVPEYRDNLALCDNNLGKLLQDTGRPEEAARVYQDALALQTKLAADSPGVSDYQNDLARTMVNMAMLLSDTKKFSRARELLHRAEPHHRAALKANPKNPLYRELFRANRQVLTTTLAALGDHSGAAQTAAELARAPLADPYDAACALALCVPLAENDDKLAADQRRQQARSYADQAMTMLRQAVSEGVTNADQITKDKDLASLRKRDDFQKLLAELEKKHGSPAN